MRVIKWGALVALVVVGALACSTREGQLQPGTTSTQGGGGGVGPGGTGGTGAHAGSGGHGGTGAQGGGGASNLCVLGQSKLNQCVLAP